MEVNEHFPAQSQSQPGKQSEMNPIPNSVDKNYKPGNKLQDKVAIITGGDSGIGRSISLYYAMEGADVAIVYLNETEDAISTTKLVEQIGRKCIRFSGDIANVDFCKKIAQDCISTFGHIDILVNNAGEQHIQENFENISQQQLLSTFNTNIFSYFYMTQAVLPFLKKGSCIINTTSVTAYHGNPKLIDYSATKGAIVSFTRSLAINLTKKGIRVNAVAPGPIWTPLIPSSFSAHDVEKFGSETPMKRAGQPKEVAPCYVFLASDDSSYMSGQVLHPNGGVIING